MAVPHRQIKKFPNNILTDQAFECLERVRRRSLVPRGNWDNRLVAANARETLSHIEVLRNYAATL